MSALTSTQSSDWALASGISRHRRLGPPWTSRWPRPSWNGSASWTRWRSTPDMSCRLARWRGGARAAAHAAGVGQGQLGGKQGIQL
ncbi:hypothetical protein G6F57_021694 [Rhizopus arrhizus]|nr:hypothetical protein G6F57_021694 [Rhizopus arrhizus]